MSSHHGRKNDIVKRGYSHVSHCPPLFTDKKKRLIIV
jgi:hypothetical protein